MNRDVNMATDRPNSPGPEPHDPRTQHQALVASLHAAVEALTTCVESIYDLIEHVDAIANPEDTHVERRRARVSYGGGLSPLASRGYGDYATGRLSAASAAAIADAAGIGQLDHRLGLPDDPGELDEPAGPTAPADDFPTGNRPVTARPGAPALMAAADLAHRGYSREEIAERLHDRWGEAAGPLLRELME
jgi:hypothetical protein